MTTRTTPERKRTRKKRKRKKKRKTPTTTITTRTAIPNEAAYFKVVDAHYAKRPALLCGTPVSARFSLPVATANITRGSAGFPRQKRPGVAVFSVKA